MIKLNLVTHCWKVQAKWSSRSKVIGLLQHCAPVRWVGLDLAQLLELCAPWWSSLASPQGAVPFSFKIFILNFYMYRLLALTSYDQWRFYEINYWGGQAIKVGKFCGGEQNNFLHKKYSIKNLITCAIADRGVEQFSIFGPTGANFHTGGEVPICLPRRTTTGCMWMYIYFSSSLLF